VLQPKGTPDTPCGVAVEGPAASRVSVRRGQDLPQQVDAHQDSVRPVRISNAVSSNGMKSNRIVIFNHT